MGFSQASSVYILGSFPSEDGQDVGSTWGESFLGGGLAVEQSLQALPLLLREGNLHACVLCDSVALRALGTSAKLYALCSQMSDVEAGGATVFPDLGAAIWPKKVSSSPCES